MKKIFFLLYITLLFSCDEKSPESSVQKHSSPISPVANPEPDSHVNLHPDSLLNQWQEDSLNAAKQGYYGC